MKNESTMIILSIKNRELIQTMTSISKRNIHGNKVLLCIWWNMKGILYYELLKPETSNSHCWALSTIINRFESFFDQKCSIIAQRKRKLILLDDNVLDHTLQK